MSQEPFGDIPLFREIQRLLSSSEGPVNVEIARQVGTALAAQGLPDPEADDATARLFADAVRNAEVLLSGYTRLPLIEPIRTTVVTRARWVRMTLDGWKWLLDHLGRRFTSEMASLGAESPAEPGEAADPMRAAVAQIAPLALGIQAGTLLGNLAQEVTGRYDPPILRDDDGRLFFLPTNVSTLVDEYGFDGDAFRQWIALHDVALHLLVIGVPWLGPYFRSLLMELVDAIEIDVSDLERRMIDLQTKGMESLQEEMGSAPEIPTVPTERHRKALGRLHAFVAVLEGYATHACKAVASEAIGDTGRIDEGMARHNASPSEGKAMMEGLLGLALDRSLENSGVTFCAAVVKLKGINALNEIWSAPDNLPTIEEIRDPFSWIERVLET